MFIFILFARSVDISFGIFDRVLMVILLSARQAESLRDINRVRTKISILF
jgi:hypothetical protein